jgi:hypothetical protein
MTALFIPVVPGAITDNTVRSAERACREAFDVVLKDREVAAAIAPMKSNGSIAGHKILDDNSAVETIISLAPAAWKSALTDSRVTAFRRIQIFNGVLRKYFEMDSKTGKLTGNQAPSYVKRLEARKAKDEAPTQ